MGPHLLAMSGSIEPPHRCHALSGEVGCSVGCKIYENRPSPCREFNPLNPDGSINERCRAAREAFGLDS